MGRSICTHPRTGPHPLHTKTHKTNNNDAKQVHFGTPTPEEKEAFTLVLQGHIALAQAVFPEGTMGACRGVDVCMCACRWMCTTMPHPPQSVYPLIHLQPNQTNPPNQPTSLSKCMAGSKLDILARLPLWSRGLDYKHGTGQSVFE